MKDLYRRFLSEEGWLIEEKNWNKNLQGVNESLFTLGNGYIGSRGVLEEIPYDAYPGTYIAGLYDKSGSQVPELVNLPNPIDFKISAKGEKLGLIAMDVLRHSRILDMKKGLLVRHTIYSNVRNERFDYQSIRFMSMDEPHIGVMQISFTPMDNDADISAQTTFDTSVTNKGILTEGRKRHFQVMEVKRIRDIYYACVQTFASKVYVGCAGLLNICSGPRTHNVSERVFHLRVEKAKTICFTKIFHIATSREIHPKSIKRHTLRALRRSAEIGFEGLLERHTASCQKRWRDADVIIQSDKALQKAVRFNIYHMLICGNDKAASSIGARTLSGEGYRGHIFWDAEIFILPFFLYTNPAVARNMLSYRHARLAEARRLAKRSGYKGAMFPWESADRGADTTPPWHKDLDGRIIKIHTMDTEQHINCDIAYAVEHYRRVTGDEKFMLDEGYELFFEIARFWASRVKFNRLRRRYEILRVMGPDEFHPVVNNNAFTNGMVSWNLKRAYELYNENKEKGNKRFAALARRIHLSRREAQAWADIASAIVIPHSERNGLIEQFEGYFRKAHIPIRELDHNFMPVLPKGISYKNIDKTQFVKQPDTLMLLYLLDGEFSADDTKKNFAYYDARTLHKSSLSAAVSSIIALRAGDTVKACRYLSYAAYTDLNNLNGNTADGIHAASLGGTWQAFVNGLGGMRLKDDTLSFDPIIPREFRSVRFKVKFRSFDVSVAAFRNRIEVKPISRDGAEDKFRFEAFGRIREAPVGVKSVYKKGR